MTDASTPWARAMARAMQDPAFKKRLMADPAATLRAAGVPVPDGVAVKVHQNAEHEVHMVLPASPDDDALSDTELERVAAGLKGLQCSKLASGCGAGIG